MLPLELRTFTRLGVTLAMAALLSACHRGGTRPDDMSEADHVTAAALHRQQADKSKQLGSEQSKIRAFPLATSESYRWSSDRYDPYGNATAARKHEHAAEAHLAAAQTLRTFENASCGDFPAELRARCPLLGTVASVAPTDDGVRLALEAGVDFEAVVAHIRCHLAFARSAAHEGMAACPLYLPEVKIHTEEGFIFLESARADVARDLRARVASHLASAAPEGAPE